MERLKSIIQKMTHKKMEIALIAGILLALLIGEQLRFSQVCDEIRQDTLRLHIRAASDSAQDQADKLAVRDAILAHSESLLEDPQTLQQAQQTLQQKLDEIQQIAEQTLKLRGNVQPVQVSITNMLFDTVEYETFTMPAGEYTALRVDIGAAEGKNWWCVMFPPMCIAAVQPESIQQYSQQEQVMLEKGYEIRFALVEWWQHLKTEQPAYDGC